MTDVSLPISYDNDVQLVRIAREIAMDLNDIETILQHYKITPKQFETLKTDPRFLRLLDTEITAWNGATNTHERTKLKASALIEEWLLEANARIHDKTELLSAKTEVVKLLARIAGMGNERVDPTASAGGERFNITINLGSDHKLEFSKTVTPKVIDAVATPVVVETSDDEEDE